MAIECFWTDLVGTFENCVDGGGPTTWTGTMLNQATDLYSPAAFRNEVAYPTGFEDPPPAFSDERVLYGSQLVLCVPGFDDVAFTAEYGDAPDTYSGFIRDVTVFKLDLDTNAVIDNEVLGDFAMTFRDLSDGNLFNHFIATVTAPALAADPTVAWGATATLDLTSSGAGTPITAAVGLHYVHHANEKVIEVDTGAGMSANVYPIETRIDASMRFQTKDAVESCDPFVLDIEVDDVPDAAAIDASCL